MLVHPPQVLHGVRLGVDVDGRLLHDVEAAHFVEAEGVVDVVVCEEDGVAAPELRGEGLLAQVGRGVDQHRARVAGGVGKLDGGAGAEAGVARIGAGADGAVAGDGGDASRGAGAEKSEAHRSEPRRRALGEPAYRRRSSKIAGLATAPAEQAPSGRAGQPGR